MLVTLRAEQKLAPQCWGYHNHCTENKVEEVVVAQKVCISLAIATVQLFFLIENAL